MFALSVWKYVHEPWTFFGLPMQQLSTVSRDGHIYGLMFFRVFYDDDKCNFTCLGRRRSNHTGGIERLTAWYPERNFLAGNKSESRAVRFPHYEEIICVHNVTRDYRRQKIERSSRVGGSEDRALPAIEKCSGCRNYSADVSTVILFLDITDVRLSTSVCSTRRYVARHIATSCKRVCSHFASLIMGRAMTLRRHGMKMEYTARNSNYGAVHRCLSEQISAAFAKNLDCLVVH